MTLPGRYAAGVTVVAVLGLVALALAPDTARAGIGWGLVVGLLLQAPLGWWTLRALGTERFLTVWGLGMLVRFGVVAVAAFALMPGPYANNGDRRMTGMSAPCVPESAAP